MWMYLGVKRRSLPVLLYHVVAMHLYSFSFMFSYICIIQCQVYIAFQVRYELIGHYILPVGDKKYQL